MSLESRIFSVLYFTQKNYNYFLNFEHVDVCCIFVLQISDKHGVLISTHLWVLVTCCRHMTKPSHAMFLPALCQCNLRAFFPTVSAAWAGCMPTMKQRTYASVSSLSLSLPLSPFLSLCLTLWLDLFFSLPLLNALSGASDWKKSAVWFLADKHVSSPGIPGNVRVRMTNSGPWRNASDHFQGAPSLTCWVIQLHA